MSEQDGPQPRPRRRAGRPVGETLGGILAGFDQQVLRQQPPAHELVLKGSPVRGLAGDDPASLEIMLPATSEEPDGDDTTPTGQASTAAQPPTMPDDPASVAEPDEAQA